MKHIFAGEQANKLLGPWICTRLDIPWNAAAGACIGLIGPKGVYGAAMFDEYMPERCVSMTIVGTKGNWLTRDFIFACADYAFNQLGVAKIICTTFSENVRSIRGLEHLGFSLEATLKDASPKGDRLFYSLDRSDCRWLSLRTSNGTETIRAEAA